jgi:hypothetical protein
VYGMTAWVEVTCKPLFEIPPVPSGSTVTVAEADFVESAWLVAVTVTFEPEGTAEGAEYRPLEMVPTLELPPVVPLTDQVTAVFVVPETETKKAMVVEICMVALAGVMATVTEPPGVGPGGGGGSTVGRELFPPTRPAHDEHISAIKTVTTKRLAAFGKALDCQLITLGWEIFCLK